MSTKIAYYIRTSTKSQISSIDNQPEYFTNYIQYLKEEGLPHDFEVVEVYIDWGETGTSISRRHFLHMLNDCGVKTFIKYEDNNGLIIDREIILPPRNNNNAKFIDNKYLKQEAYYFKPPNTNIKPEYTEIWVKTTSRFGRSINDLTNILKHLNQQKIYVRFIEQNLFSAQNEDMPKIAEAFISDSNYSARLSRDIRTSRQTRAKRKQLIGSAKIFGYDYVAQIRQNHRIIQEAQYKQNKSSDTVKEIFETYASTKSMLKTSKAIMKNNKPFPLTSLKKIIDNPVYAGINTSLRSSVDDKSLKMHSILMNLDNDNPIYELSEHIEAIITPELFFECQRIKSKNTIVINDKKIGKSNEYDPYLHYLKCLYCSNSFLFDANKGNGYYTCRTKEDNGYGVYNPNVTDYHLQKCNVVNIYKSELLDYLNYLSKGGLYYHIQLATQITLDDVCYNIDNYFKTFEDNKIDSNKIMIAQQLDDLSAEYVEKSSEKDASKSQGIKDLISNRLKEIDNRIHELEQNLNNLNKMADEEYITDELNKLKKIINTLMDYKKFIPIDDLWDYIDYIKVAGVSNKNGGFHKPAAILTPVIKNFKFNKKSKNSNYFYNQIYSKELEFKGIDLPRQLEIYYKEQIKKLNQNL